MSYRIQRKKKIKTIALPQGQIFKMRLIPWIRTQSGCVWLASLAVAKSKRQLNDWLYKRPKKSTAQLSASLTGQLGPQIQAIGIRQLRQWIENIPAGDSICMRCESALPDKQFSVWKKWFQRHEDPHWEICEENKSFFFYKSRL